MVFMIRRNLLRVLTSESFTNNIGVLHDNSHRKVSYAFHRAFLNQNSFMLVQSTPKIYNLNADYLHIMLARGYDVTLTTHWNVASPALIIHSSLSSSIDRCRNDEFLSVKYRVWLWITNILTGLNTEQQELPWTVRWYVVFSTLGFISLTSQVKSPSSDLVKLGIVIVFELMLPPFFSSFRSIWELGIIF